MMSGLFVGKIQMQGWNHLEAASSMGLAPELGWLEGSADTVT